MATTAFCTSAKKELLQAVHCFNAAVTPTGNTHTTTTVDNVSSMTGVAVGMSVTGSGVTAGSVVANIVSTTSFLLSIATTTSLTGTTLTIGGDVFKIALVRTTPTGTYDGNVTNVGTPGSGSPTTANLGTDETSGTGYSSGGVTLTNVTPSLQSGVATTQFSPNPSWTTATFSAVAAIIYNSSDRSEGVVNRAISVHDFGGTQSVSAGTFTVVMPTYSSTLALLRIA